MILNVKPSKVFLFICLIAFSSCLTKIAKVAGAAGAVGAEVEGSRGPHNQQKEISLEAPLHSTNIENQIKNIQGHNNDNDYGYNSEDDPSPLKENKKTGQGRIPPRHSSNPLNYPLNIYLQKAINKSRDEAQPEHFIDALNAFIQAINWKDSRMIHLIGFFHAFQCFFVFFSRKNNNLLIAYLAFALCVVLSLGPLNNLVGQAPEDSSFHWKHFTDEPYFDQNGLFVSAVIAAPLSIIATIATCMLLYNMISLMIIVKAKEIKLSRQSKAK